MRKSDAIPPNTGTAGTTNSVTPSVIPVRLRERGVALPPDSLPAVAPKAHLRSQKDRPPQAAKEVVEGPGPIDSDDAIGYKKPPRHTQFQKGISGNPRGRPSNSRNTATIFNDESDARITVTENGKATRLSKRELVLKGVVNKAAKGEPKAVATFLKLDERYRPADPKDNLSEAAQTKFLMEEDAAILAHYGIGVSCADDTQEKPLEPTTSV